MFFMYIYYILQKRIPIWAVRFLKQSLCYITLETSDRGKNIYFNDSLMFSCSVNKNKQLIIDKTGKQNVESVDKMRQSG